jgi:hypothetical protein
VPQAPKNSTTAIRNDDFSGIAGYKHVLPPHLTINVLSGISASLCIEDGNLTDVNCHFLDRLQPLHNYSVLAVLAEPPADRSGGVSHQGAAR